MIACGFLGFAFPFDESIPITRWHSSVPLVSATVRLPNDGNRYNSRFDFFIPKRDYVRLTRPDKRKHRFQAPVMYDLHQSSHMCDYVITANGAPRRKENCFLSLWNNVHLASESFSLLASSCVMWWRNGKYELRGPAKFFARMWAFSLLCIVRRLPPASRLASQNYLKEIKQLNVRSFNFVLWSCGACGDEKRWAILRANLRNSPRNNRFSWSR